MIPDSDKSDVYESTSNTEKEHIPKDMYVSIQAENKLLRQEITKLLQQNQTLHNCWQSAIAHHIEAQTEARAWISRAAFKDAEIGELRRQIVELQEHLNPLEEAA